MVAIILMLAQVDPQPREFTWTTFDRGVRFTLATEVRAWWPDLRGRAILDDVLGVETTASEDTGPDFDFASDGGFGDSTFAPEFRVEIGSYVTGDGSASIRARWWKGEWSASHLLQQPGDFGGPALPAGTLVESEFDIRMYRLELVMRLRPPPHSPWSSAVYVGLGLYRTSLEVDTPLGESRDRAGGGGLTAGFDVLWHPVRWMFAKVDASAIVQFGVPMADVSVSGGLRLGPLRIEGGYRWMWASMEAWSENLQFAMDGPFLELEARF